MKVKLLVSAIGILTIWSFLSIYLIATKQETIEDNEYEISDLADQVDQLQDDIEELESINEDLQSQVDALESAQDNTSFIFSGSNSRNSYNQTIVVEPTISEEAVYLSQGSAIVTYTQSGCDYIILEDNRGYIVAECYGGSYPYVGNKIAGDFHGYGIKEYYNTNRDGQVKLYIDDFMLSKDRAMERIAEKCD